MHLSRSSVKSSTTTLSRKCIVRPTDSFRLIQTNTQNFRARLENTCNQAIAYITINEKRWYERKFESTDSSKEVSPNWSEFRASTFERLQSPQRRQAYLAAILALGLVKLVLGLIVYLYSNSSIDDCLEQKDDEEVVTQIFRYVGSISRVEFGMEGEERKKQLLHLLSKNPKVLEVLFRGLADSKATPLHFTNCVSVLSELMEDELSCTTICQQMPFGSLFNSSKSSLLNSLNDVQRFMLFYLLQQCSMNDVGLQRMSENPNLIRAFVNTFQKYQQNEFVKIQDSNVPDAQGGLRVHTATQIAMLLTVMHLSKLETVQPQFKQYDSFMRVLNLVGNMHRMSSLKAVASASYMNITKNAHIIVNMSEQKSVHKYNRLNTLTFYGTSLGIGLAYGFASAFQGNKLYSGLKGSALVTRSLKFAAATALGSVLLGGFIRDAQAVATDHRFREKTESSIVAHSLYSVGKVAYLGMGAFVLNAAFPHVILPAIASNMCLTTAVNGVKKAQAFFNEDSKSFKNALDAKKKL